MSATLSLAPERDIVASAAEEAAIVLVSARKGELALRGVQRKTLRKESYHALRTVALACGLSQTHFRFAAGGKVKEPSSQIQKEKKR